MSFVEFVNQEEQKEKVAGCGSAAPPSAPAQPASPLFLMGHSTGALVCSLSMLRTPPPPARGLVLHSALMGVEWTLLLRCVVSGWTSTRMYTVWAPGACAGTYACPRELAVTEKELIAGVTGKQGLEAIGVTLACRRLPTAYAAMPLVHEAAAVGPRR